MRASVCKPSHLVLRSSLWHTLAATFSLEMVKLMLTEIPNSPGLSSKKKMWDSR